MRAYWFKIMLGALVIFCVGLTGVTIARRIKGRVESNADIHVPLRFVPFRLDGVRVGTFRRLVIHRQRPNMVSSVNLAVRLEDSAATASLKACSLSVENPTEINEHTTFRCVQPDSNLAQFGEVSFEVRDAEGNWGSGLVVPLLLSHRAIREFQGGRADAVAGQAAAEDGRAMADSITQEVSMKVREATRSGEDAVSRAQDAAKKTRPLPVPRPPPDH